MAFDAATLAGLAVFAVVAWFLWNNRDDRKCDDMAERHRARRPF